MKKLMTMIAVIAVAAVLASSPAEARRGWGGGYQGEGYYDLTAAPGLNLTAEQVTTLNALRDAHLRDVKPLQDQMYSKRGELRNLWLERTPDQKKILAVQKDLQTLRDKLYKKGTLYRLDAQKVLSPEQQAQVQTYGTGRGYGYGYGKGMRGHGGKGMRGHGGMGMRGY